MINNKRIIVSFFWFLFTSAFTSSKSIINKRELGIPAIGSGNNVAMSSSASEEYYFVNGSFDKKNGNCWIPHSNDPDPWIQVGFIDPVHLEQIQTYFGELTQDQFCSDCQWVSSYTVQISINGVDWIDVNEGEEFVGDIGTDSVATNEITSAPICRSVRIYPSSHNCLRFEILYSELTDEETIHQLRHEYEIAALMTGAKVHFSNYYHLSNVFHYFLESNLMSSDGSSCGWRSNENGGSVKISVRNPVVWTRLVIAGSCEFVSYDAFPFKIYYSMDGKNYFDYNSGELINSNGNNDEEVETTFEPPFVALSLKIWFGDLSAGIRFEIFYKEVKDLTVSYRENTSIMSSTFGNVVFSSFEESIFPYFYFVDENDGNNGWIPDITENLPWMIIGLGEARTWSAVSLRSSCDFRIYFNIQCTNDGKSWSNRDIYDASLSDSSTHILEFSNAKSGRAARIILTSIPENCWIKFDFIISVGKIEISLSDDEVSAISSGAYVETSSLLESKGIYKYGYSLNQQSAPVCGWMPLDDDPNKWISIGTSSYQQFTGVSIQGRYQPDSLDSYSKDWTTAFKISTSLDGNNWTQFEDGRLFIGNSDQYSTVTYQFNSPPIGKTIRILPIQCKNFCALRIEVYYKRLTVKQIQELNTQSLTSSIYSGSSIRQSTYNFEDLSLKYMLDYKIQENYNAGKILFNDCLDCEQYFQISEDIPKLWKSIQVRPDSNDLNCRLKKYMLKYSINGRWFYPYNSEEVISANEAEIDEISSFDLTKPLIARTIQIVPCEPFNPGTRIDASFVSFNSEFDDEYEIGAIEGGAVVDMSSYFYEDHTDSMFRLGYHLQEQGYIYSHCWKAKENNQEQWIQISTTYPQNWNKISTQGRHVTDHYCATNNYCNPTLQEYVKKYKISYSQNGRDWVQYDNGSQFTANSDTDNIIDNTINIEAKSIRIHPTEWESAISMRIEAYYYKACDWKCSKCLQSNWCYECSSEEGVVEILNQNTQQIISCSCGDEFEEDYDNSRCKRISKFDLLTN